MFPHPSDLVTRLPEVILIVAITCNGLSAGAFFVFACTIVPGFRGLDDSTYVSAFRAINRAILNGWFLSVFLGAPTTAIAGAIAGFVIDGATASVPLLLGVGLSFLTVAITAAVNVPLNRGLEEAPAETDERRRAARLRFEGLWNRCNLIRTLTSLGALACLSVATFA